MTDRQIVSVIIENDLHECEQVFRELYGAYFGMIENLVLSRKGTKEDAKDVFQDAIISFYNSVKRQRFKMNCSVSTYIYAIARNVWNKKQSKSGREISLPEDTSLDMVEDTNILDYLEQNETQKLIARVLVKMGEPCRKILYYFYYENLRMKRIADLLNFSSEQVAKNQKSKCMKKLRAFILEKPFYKRYLEDRN